jgi:hypothetical protein
MLSTGGFGLGQHLQPGAVLSRLQMLATTDGVQSTLTRVQTSSTGGLGQHWQPRPLGAAAQDAATVSGLQSNRTVEQSCATTTEATNIRFNNRITLLEFCCFLYSFCWTSHGEQCQPTCMKFNRGATTRLIENAHAELKSLLGFY